jgi:hypothetical protein
LEEKERFQKITKNNKSYHKKYLSSAPILRPGDGGSNLPKLGNSHVTIFVQHCTNISKNYQANSVPQAAGCCLCFLGHRAIVPRTGLDSKKGQIQPLWRIQLHLATGWINFLIFEMDFNLQDKKAAFERIFFLYHPSRLIFSIVNQVIQPNKTRSRLKGKISIAEFNKYLQSHCGFVCTRTRRRNLTRYFLNDANLAATLLAVYKVDVCSVVAVRQEIGSSSTADGLTQQTRMIAACSAPTTTL